MSEALGKAQEMYKQEVNAKPGDKEKNEKVDGDSTITLPAKLIPDGVKEGSTVSLHGKLMGKTKGGYKFEFESINISKPREDAPTAATV
jgi:hypothetical protein